MADRSANTPSPLSTRSDEASHLDGPPSKQPTPLPVPATPSAAETVGESASTAGDGDTKEPSRVGLEFDDLVLMDEVGRGGMGIVYKARQKSLDRVVAVKLLPGDPVHKTPLVTRFLAEARAAAGLNHPNIVRIYQIGQCPAGHYFAMELIDGLDLEKLTLRDGQCVQMPLHWSVDIMIPVAQAVAYAHTHGIVHRDLKPSNVMLDLNKRPVVMDFGIAKLIGQSTGLTEQGAILGTPAYMAPEQAGDEPDKVGPLSDVYSLGAILYRLLTGRLTYAASSLVRTLFKVVAPKMPPPVRSLRPEVPATLEQLVMKCLSKRPADRYPSAKALAQALSEELPRLRVAQPEAKNMSDNVLADTSARASKRAQSAGKTPAPLAPAITLVVVKTGQQIRLCKSVNTIGRSADCEVKLKAGDVSKHHCRLVLKRGALTVEDLNSANGTFVNGDQITSAVLKGGDLLAVASHTFEVRLLKSDE